MNKIDKSSIVLALAIEQSSDQELIEQIRENYKNDLLLFSSICTTEDPHDRKRPFKLFPTKKLPYIKKFANAFLKEHRTVILKSRQIMATWFFCIAALWDILFNKGSKGAFVSKKGEDSRKLIERMKFIYDNLPDWKSHVNFVMFPQPKAECQENWSVVYAYPQGADQLRSQTFSWIFSDEFAFQEDQDKTWRSSKPTVDGGGRFIACSTPNGAGNLFYHFWNDPSFYKIEVHYSENPFKNEKWKKEARKGMREKDWQQEYETNFLATQENTIFGDFNYKLHVKEQIFQPQYPLLVGWDFGYNRPAIVWCQYYDAIFRILKSFLGYKITLDKFAEEVFKIEKEHFESPIAIFDYCDSAGLQINKQTGMTDIQVLNKLFESRNRYLRFKKSTNLEEDFAIIRNFMNKLVKGEVCFQIDPSNVNIIEGFRGGMHYHGDTQRVCGCTNANEFFEFERDYYKHLNDCIRFIFLNNFGIDGPINSKQDKLVIPSTKDKRFQFERIVN